MGPDSFNLFHIYIDKNSIHACTLRSAGIQILNVETPSRYPFSFSIFFYPQPLPLGRKITTAALLAFMVP